MRRSHRLALALVILLAASVPAPGLAREPLGVAVISDLNGSYGTTDYAASVDAAIDRIIALGPALVISTGDMVAGQRRPHLTRPEVERMWQAFHERVSDRLGAAGIPLAVTPGNHDGSAYQGFRLERAIYAEQWTARRPDVRFLDDAHYPFRYAFAKGDTLFVALDVTTVGHLASAQMQWLRELLARHGRGFQHRVVFSHLPLWPFAHGREQEHIGDPALQTLLEQADVDLFLSGHHHAFYPGSRGGVAFVSQSCLGGGPRRLLGAPKKTPKGFTWIEFADRPIALAAYSAPSFDSPIDWHSLPRRLVGGGVELIRADLSAATILPLETGAARKTLARQAPPSMSRSTTTGK